jgi:hypothetical protein
MVSSAEIVSAEVADLPDPFQIVSIRAVAAPPGTAGANWHRYEICQGNNRIVGYRAGAVGPVREAVELIVIGLNMRRSHRRGRVHVVLDSGAKRGLR